MVVTLLTLSVINPQIANQIHRLLREVILKEKAEAICLLETCGIH